MTKAWQPISTAPRDGTALTLTWVEDGKPQEIYPNMLWNVFAENKFFQHGKGIWAAHDTNTGKLLFTWTEEGGNGPTHWLPLDPNAAIDFDELMALPVREAV